MNENGMGIEDTQKKETADNADTQPVNQDGTDIEGNGISPNTGDLFSQFARVEWLLHRSHQHNHRMHGPMGDPHRGQGRVLKLLRMQPEISQKDLSFLLDMRQQSLGELLAKLERAGFITRTPSESDRRVVNIKLTAEGAKTAEKQADSGNVFDCLEAEEQLALSGYLSRIIALLEKQFGDERPDSEEESSGHAMAGFPFDRPFMGRGGGGHGRSPFDPRFGSHGMEGQPAFDGPHESHGPHCMEGQPQFDGSHGKHCMEGHPSFDGPRGSHDMDRVHPPCGGGRGHHGGGHGRGHHRNEPK